MLQCTSVGWVCASAASSRPIRASAPGTKFSTSTSLAAIKRRNTSSPASCFRSSTTLRLPRPRRSGDRPRSRSRRAPPCTPSGPIQGGDCHVWSPPGGSTRITSAPSDASSHAHTGPDTMRLASITRMPSSGFTARDGALPGTAAASAARSAQCAASFAQRAEGERRPSASFAQRAEGERRPAASFAQRAEGERRPAGGRSVNRDNLIDGKGFVMRVVRLNTLFSLPALAIVLGCAWALLDLPPELWKGLFAGIAIYTVVASPVSFLLQRRTTTAIAEWLDADAPDEDTTQRAFVAMLALPLRTAHLATTNWLAPTLLISIGMKLSYADLW